jgi:hypothetical protein
MVYLHVKFHIPNSDSSLMIAINPKARYRFHGVAILLSYILEKKLSGSGVFLKDLLPDSILRPYIKGR